MSPFALNSFCPLLKAVLLALVCATPNAFAQQWYHAPQNQSNQDTNEPFWARSNSHRTQTENSVPAKPTQVPASEVSSRTTVQPAIHGDIPETGPVKWVDPQDGGALSAEAPLSEAPLATPQLPDALPGAPQENPLILPGSDFQNGGQAPDPGPLPPGPRFRNNDLPTARKILASEFAGWQQAGSGFDAERLDTELRANWVMLDRIGRLKGRVLNYSPGEGPRSGMTVFLVRRGVLLSSETVDPDGSFIFNGIDEGSYTLVGSSPDSFFTFSVNLLRYREGSQAPSELVTAAMPAPVAFSAAWIKAFGPEVRFRPYGVHETGQAASDPARWYGVNGISEFDPVGASATSIYNHRVAPLSDGRLVGRLHQMDSVDGRPVDVRNTRVLLVQGVDIVQHTRADNYGVFEFLNVAPGEYGLMAAGDDGVGAIGLNVVEDVSMGAVRIIDFCLANSEATGWINQHLTKEDYLNRVLAPRNRQKDCNCNTYNVQQLLAQSRERYKYGCLTDNREFHNRCQGRGGCGDDGQMYGGCSSCGQAGCQGDCGAAGHAGGCGNPNCMNNQQNNYNSRLGAAYRRCDDCNNQQGQGTCNQCQNAGQNVPCGGCGQPAGNCQCGGGN